MRAAVLAFLLAGCSAAPPVAPPPAVDAPELRFRACQPLSPPLPRVRTVEALGARLDELEKKYPDCAERLRQAVEAFDRLKNTLTPQ